MSEENKANQASTSASAGQRLRKNGKPRMARGKFWGIVGVCCLVVAVAGLGMLKWHEEPSFCATMCHIETDYLNNYEQPQNQPGTDKYGQPVSNTNAMLAVKHRQTEATALPTITCIDCHGSNVAELASDGMHFVSGTYVLPRDERSLSTMTAWDNKEGTQFCVNERCHSYLAGEDGKVDYGKLEDLLDERDFNPHQQYHPNMSLECSNCHKAHRASTLACSGCHEHENAELPDGWLNYQDGEEAYQNGLKSSKV